MKPTIIKSVWLSKEKKAAEEVFSQLPNLNLKYGTTVMIDISSLDLSTIDPQPIEWEVEAPNDVTITAIENASEEILRSHIWAIFPEQKDKATALHAARWQSGILITIPKNSEAELKITAHSRADSIQHIVIIAEENSKAYILYKTRAEAFMSSAIELFAERNANVNITRIHSGKSWSFDYKIARQNEASSVRWTDVYTDCHFLRSETTSILSGRGSNTSIKTAFIGKQSEQLDIEASAIHNAPNTTSDIQAKGALKDNSKNIYRGLIHMTTQADNGIGKQKEDVLLLDEKAEADSIPKLVIDNNNVRCGHAASIGHIDNEKLFYLMSRGLSEQSARQTIVDGFFEPIKKELQIEELTIR